jgi:hypothetical protein
VPSVIGPILTVGVALGAAAVVVANPVIAPRADLRIPAVNLSTNSTGNDALAMLDEDFLAAIAPTPTASSTHPFAILKDLVNGIVADAAYLGETAIVQAAVHPGRAQPVATGRLGAAGTVRAGLGRDRCCAGP